MAKKKSKFGKKMIFVLNVIPFNQQCIVVVNGTFEDAYKLFKKHKTPNSLRTIEHIEKEKEEYFNKIKITEQGCLYTELPAGYVMLLKHQESWIDTVGTTSHECTHLTKYVLERAGISLTNESQEIYTYLQGYCLQEILKKIY